MYVPLVAARLDPPYWILPVVQCNIPRRSNALGPDDTTVQPFGPKNILSLFRLFKLIIANDWTGYSKQAYTSDLRNILLGRTIL